MSSAHNGLYPARKSSRKRLILLLAVTVLVVVAGLLIWSAQNSDNTSSFPDQLPNTTSDVSSAQAFRDHGIVIPASMSSLLYSASTQDGYPLIAKFHLTCDSGAQFVSDNQLAQAQLAKFQDIDLETIAEQLGWDSNSEGAEWYSRSPGGSSGDSKLEAMIQPEPGYCQVFLVSNK